MSHVSRPDWAGRLRALQSALPAHDLDALVVSGPVNITYLTGFDGSAAIALVTRTGVRLISDGRYEFAIRDARAGGRLADVAFVRVQDRYDLTLAETIADAGAAAVGFEAAHVTVATWRRWQQHQPHVRWIELHDTVERLRLVKDAWEQDVFRRAGQRLAHVAGRIPDWIRPGRTERDVARDVERDILAGGFARIAFPTIVASGPNSALPHARPTDRVLAPGDLVVLDFGGVLDGYCVDLTRMAAIEPVSPEARALFAAVQAAQAAALAVVTPGLDVVAVDKVARDVLDARGLGDAFMHGTGHGLGLEVHEAPRVARRGVDDPVRLEPGMVFTIEPGAYVSGLGGVRLEDDVLVTATGCEVLTEAPRELVVV